MHTYMQLVTQMYLHLFRSALQIITTVSHEKTALLCIKISVWCQTRLFSLTGLKLSSGSPYTPHWCCFVSENARVLVLSSKIVTWLFPLYYMIVFNDQYWFMVLILWVHMIYEPASPRLACTFGPGHQLSARTQGDDVEVRSVWAFPGVFGASEKTGTDGIYTKVIWDFRNW